jgi:hypothetical protein
LRSQLLLLLLLLLLLPHPALQAAMLRSTAAALPKLPLKMPGKVQCFHAAAAGWDRGHSLLCYITLPGTPAALSLAGMPPL